LGVLLGYAATFALPSVFAMIAPASDRGWLVDGDIRPPLLAYAGAVFWTLGYDTIYAVQDLEDDALAGVKSSARRLGTAAPQAVLGFYAAAIALTLGAGWAAHLGPMFWPFAAVYALTLLRQPLRLKLDDPAGALALFRANTLSGLVLFLAIAAGFWRP
jgi:4-hydroxybenzoate polyprenyltransferase